MARLGQREAPGEEALQVGHLRRGGCGFWRWEGGGERELGEGVRGGKRRCLPAFVHMRSVCLCVFPLCRGSSGRETPDHAREACITNQPTNPPHPPIETTHKTTMQPPPPPSKPPTHLRSRHGTKEPAVPHRRQGRDGGGDVTAAAAIAAVGHHRGQGAEGEADLEGGETRVDFCLGLFLVFRHVSPPRPSR